MPLALPPLLLAAASAAAAQPVDMLVYPNPGMFDVSSKGEVSGPGADLIGRLAEVSGVALKLQVVPAARALQMAVHLPGRCVAGLPRTPDREAVYRWAGPMAAGAMVLYGRPGDARAVQGPEDLRGATIAAMRDSQPLAWLRAHGLRGEEVNDTVTGLRMLRAGRVDYWVVNDIVGQRAIRSEAGETPRPLLTLGRIEVYIACHAGTPQALVDRLHAGLGRLRRDGALADFGLR